MLCKHCPFVLAGCLLAGGFVAGADNDLLDQVRRRQDVAAQVFEQEIRTALGRADRAKADPANAVEILQKALAQLEKDSTLTNRERENLLRTVRQRLKSAELAQLGQPAVSRTAEKSRRHDSPDDEAVRRGLAAVRAFRQEGKTRDAQKVADDLLRQYPDHALVQQLRAGVGAEANLRDTARIYEDKADRTMAALRDVDRSAVGPKGDIEYPANFLAISEKRKAKYVSGGVPLSDKEKAIMRSLRDTTTTPIEFKNLSFDNVIEILQKQLGQPLVVNKAALDELKIDYDVPISAAIPGGVAKRTLLKRVLNDLGLTYVVKNETIEVTSVLRAQNEMVVRYYQVDDLVGAAPFAPTTAAFPYPVGPLPNRSSPANPFAINNTPNAAQLPAFRPPLQVEELIDMIQRMVAPESWQKNGGLGSITFYAPTRTLIIKNSAEVINTLGSGSSKKE